MPLECVAIRNAAQNQIVSGSLLACMIVPAVTEVCPPAIGAFIGEGFGLEQPSTTPAATRADKLFWPTTLEEVLRTRAFRRKAVLKLE
jgi:hypothetical protein